MAAALCRPRTAAGDLLGAAGASAHAATSDDAAPERGLFGFGIARVNDKFTELPTCIVDVEAAGFKLTQAGATVRTATRVCRRDQKTEDEKLMCASAIADIIAFIGFGAEFLEGGAQQCADSLVTGTLCSETVTELIAGLAQVVQAATGIRAVCSNLTQKELFMRQAASSPRLLQGDNGTQDARRLDGWARHAAPVGSSVAAQDPAFSRGFLARSARSQRATRAQASQQTSIAQVLNNQAATAAIGQQQDEQELFNHFKCFLHASESALFVSRAADVITAAILDCGPRNRQGAEGTEACELDVVGTLESFTFAANSISRAIFRCPALLDIAAECAANIVNIVASTEALVNAVSGLNLCIKPQKDAFVEHETHLGPAPVALPAGVEVPGQQRPPGQAYTGEFYRDPGVIHLPDPVRLRPPPQPAGQERRSQASAYAPGGSVGAGQQAGEYYGPEP